MLSELFGGLSVSEFQGPLSGRGSVPPKPIVVPYKDPKRGKTVLSFARKIRQESLSMLYRFFLSDEMGSFVFSLTFSSENLAPSMFS